ncbi:alpha/beta hydrolase [Arthrobacter agilis]|uniref:alpha/beta fold hydrolase n=1 Tax=Arthrobacter agilis TaxID=37921 RepID=UPI000B3539B3|nr:alpha/beta fold hydrolase [Arthrobacter agilis]OUM42265.1 hypothetical protein B8W74_09170 [Arthrobacter agilis]PPB45606.1 alpha/beta hydrolase [Arthrobacter agilis]TPV26413.1 alpha/beta hydrolase [Arthrobacter agilis]
MPSTLLRTVQVSGCTVRVRTTPAASPAVGPPFVLVHGLGMTHRYLDRLRVELAADADVHAVDLPGFGPDPRPRVPLEVEDQAALLVEALRTLGLTSCVPVGHSMGVQFVAAAALQAPDLVDRVVLMGPVVDRRRRTVVQQAAALALDTARETASADLLVLTDYARTGMRWYVRQLVPMMRFPLERAVERLDCPVLVLRGGRDPVARRPWCLELAQRAREGIFVELEGQPHVVQHTAAPRVATEILSFCRRER